MTDYLTEQEQIEQLKGWVKQYGLTILFGIIIAVLITAGWRHWQDSRHRVLQQASITYDNMLIQRAQNNNDAAMSQAKKILKEYPKTAYADIATLLLARNAVLKKHYREAIEQLTQVAKNGQDENTRQIARTRIARILIAEHKPEEALGLLKQVNDKAYLGLVDEIRGDAYLAKQDVVSARRFYQLALQEIPDATVIQPILEMKFNNLTPEKNYSS